LEILIEFISLIVIEFIADVGDTTFRGSFQRSKETGTILGLLSPLSIGLICGFFSYLILPNPIFQKRFINGISLLILPILAGITMQLWGKYRRSKGKTSSALSTFWGGALFGFGYALVRFVIFNIL
jgi:peptidoglycan/LPS O-acetylase OafA/YrhL